jgi:nucleoid-associated protein YgaU
MKKTFLGYFLLLCAGLSLSSLTTAQERPTLKTDRPTEYTVAKGDTLWGISGNFLEDPWRWKEIWKGNTQIANPDLIYPGDIIRLIFVDGKPQLVVNSTAKTNSTTTPTHTFSGNSHNANAPLKTVKLSPKIRSSSIKTAIPAIPLDRINTFLLRNRVVDTGVLNAAPHVLAGQESRVILSAGDNIYARGDFSKEINSYGLYRAGQSYIDPDTEEVLGVQAVAIGTAGIRSIDGDKGSFTITRSTSEIRVGDRLLPHAEREITSTFFPNPPQNTVKGAIMNVETGVSQAGKLDIIAINLGAREELKQGHLLGIYKRGEKIRDRFAQNKTPKNIELPDERAGLILVFEVFEKMSLAIVLEADRGVVLQDIVSNP